jgi:glucose-6-phosphate 1-dehydrogenase
LKQRNTETAHDEKLWYSFRKSMSPQQKTTAPCVMVIVGATGDLTNRKLFPALHNLAPEKFLPENFAIVGVGRQELDIEHFRTEIIDHLREFVTNGVDEELLTWFRDRTYYTGGDFDDDKKLFGDVKNLLEEICRTRDIPPNFFYYMAIPPDLFANVAKKIVKNGLGKDEDGHWRRFIFEKPFGRDIASAKKLSGTPSRRQPSHAPTAPPATAPQMPRPPFQICSAFIGSPCSPKYASGDVIRW